VTAEWSLREDDLRTFGRGMALPQALPGLDAAPDHAVDTYAADAVRVHLDNVVPALNSLRNQSGRIAAWGVDLAHRLLRGQRLLAAGNGGSAAEAQHLTAELVGRSVPMVVPETCFSSSPQAA
jgi:D-sedoheptulose 7-phosphate isomerase